MATIKQNRSLESELLRQIAMVNLQIARLTKEHEALERTLLRIRNSSAAKLDVNRKNSVNRVVLEDTITLCLKMANEPLKVANLYNDVSFGMLDLNHNTFRSALHRMKERGFIVSPSRGKWTLSPTRR